MPAVRHTTFAMPDVGGISLATQRTERAVINTVIASFQVARIVPAFVGLGLGASRITREIQVRGRRETMKHAPATVISIAVSYSLQRNDREANWHGARNPAPGCIGGIPDLCTLQRGGTKSDSILLASLVPY